MKKEIQAAVATAVKDLGAFSDVEILASYKRAVADRVKAEDDMAAAREDHRAACDRHAFACRVEAEWLNEFRRRCGDNL